MKTQNVFFRFLLLLLALCLCASIVACAAEDDQQEGVGDESAADDTQGSEKSTLDPLEELVSLGYTYDYEDFVFLIRDNDEALRDQNVADVTDSSTMIDRAIYTRNVDLQELFKVNFVFIKEKEANFEAAVNATALFGDNAYDVVIGEGRSIFKGILLENYADWNELEYVNLDGAWWNQTARDEWTTFSGKLYAMNGDLCYQTVGNAHCMFFNKTILSNAGITSPYDQVYNDTWTQETFMETVKEAYESMDHSGTGKLGSDNFGYATQVWRGPVHVFYSTGLSMINKTEDGNYEIGWKNEPCYDVFENYRALLFDTGYAYYLYGSASDVRNAFASETVAFFDDGVKCAMEFKGTGTDFGIVPYPKATADVDGYYSMLGSGTNTFAVLRDLSAERMDRASVMLEAMACYGYTDVMPFYYETILSYQAMQDEDSLNMLRIIHDAAFFDFGHYADPASLYKIGALIIQEPGVYGQNIYTAFAVLESQVLFELNKWRELD